MEEEVKTSKEFEDGQGEKQITAFQCEIRGRVFIITTSRRIFERIGDGYRECTSEDEETKFLSKYIEPPKSLDIEFGDGR